jgi:hypothetical protein
VLQLVVVLLLGRAGELPRKPEQNLGDLDLLLDER